MDAADFDITGGALTFSKSPNYESPTDRPDSSNAGGGDNVYQVDVVATEVRAPGSLELAQDATIEVTITVNNLDEDASLTLDRLQVRAPGEGNTPPAMPYPPSLATLTPGLRMDQLFRLPRLHVVGAEGEQAGP